MKRLLFSIPLLSLFSLVAFCQVQKTPVKLSDLLKIRSISGLTLNKEASQVAFTVTKIEPDGESKTDYRYVNHIYTSTLDSGSSPRELTVKEGASQPSWSPDGKKIAFVRIADGKPQIFILSFDGGEPVQFTHFKYGAGTPKWSPDGNSILFSSNILLNELETDSNLNAGHQTPSWPIERPGLSNNDLVPSPGVKADPDGNMASIRAWLDNDLTDKKAKLLTRLDFQDETGVNSEMGFNHFFVQSLKEGASPVQLTQGFYSFSNAEFTPDGKAVVLVGEVDSLEHPDRPQESGIYMVDVNGANFRTLLSDKGMEYNSIAISHSGKWLAFQYGASDSVSVPQLAILPFDGSKKDIIKIPFDRNKSTPVWSADDKYLYFTAASNGGVPLCRADIATRKVELLSDYNSGTGSFDLKGNRLVFVKIAVADPFELYSADALLKSVKQISSFNSSWIEQKQIVFPEKHSFKNSQGVMVEYWVMKPVNYVAGKKYPLLLEIHGGPTAMWGPGESSMWHEFQFFCSKGWGVVYCNPRGSGGYGEDFLRANIKDWGAGPTSDVLTALDKAVAEGWADTSKLLVTGGSYAGYLVAWIIAHDHRFKAACSQRGVYDLSTFFGEGNAWRLVPLYFGGYPWEPATRAVLQRESPITYVQDITTPYIIFHGENDRRTGFVQGEMLYRSLKVLGKPVEYVRHPGATHEITRSGDNRQRMDQLLRTYEFFERWINH